MSNVFMVCGLGFGDEGKGSIVDYLVRKYGLRTVVRFNGSSNAAHNVVDGEFHHTFSQFGSGTLVPGVKTYLTRDVVFDPISLFYEEAHLRDLWVEDAFERFTVHPDCLVITPYHRLVCRMREDARGANRHGSTGVGLNEAVTLSIIEDLGLYARDLLVKSTAEKVLNELEDWAIETFPDLEEQIDDLDILSTMQRAVHRITIAEVIPERLRHDVVFEGAQGALLDEVFGWAPHMTRSRTTLENLIDEVDGDVFDEARKIGVMRSYTTRHGAGPLPTEVPFLPKLEGEHNGDHDYQGAFRVGALDLPLMKYGYGISHCDEIAVTHMDRFSPRVCVGYEEDEEVWHKNLEGVTPVYATLPAEEGAFISTLARTLDAPIKIISRGKEAKDKEERT